MTTTNLPDFEDGDIFDSSHVNEIKEAIQSGTIGINTDTLQLSSGSTISYGTTPPYGNTDPADDVTGTNGDIYIEANGPNSDIHMFTNTTPGTTGWSIVDLRSSYVHAYVGIDGSANTTETVLTGPSEWDTIAVDPATISLPFARNFEISDSSSVTLEYTGWDRPTEPKEISARLVVAPTGGTNDDFGIGIFRSTDSGTTWNIIGVPTLFRSRGNGQASTEPVGAVTGMSNGDLLQMRINRLNGSADLIVEYADIVIK
ncbi:hypothetical protein VPHD148_0072 [Vibrio phage D148]